MAKPKTAKTIFKGDDERTGKNSVPATSEPESLPFDSALFTPEVQRELTAFIKLVAQIQSQRKTKTVQSLDNGSAQR